jgi:hypothetical protein
MAVYDGSIRVHANINPDKISDYKINTESFERLNETLARMKKILADAVGFQTIQPSFERLSSVVQESFSELYSVLEQYNFEEMFKDIRLSVNEMAEAMNLEQIKTLQSIDFSKIFENSFYHEQYNAASQMAFDYVDEEVEGEENISQEELLEVFNAQMEDEAGWQEKIYNKTEEFKRKYFVFYKIIVCTLLFLFNQIAIYFTQKGIAYVAGDITSEPESNSTVIYYFDQRTEINIIGETDNHYFIIYPDNDGNESIGYCEKENVEIVPDGNDATIDNEIMEEENTEGTE